MTNKFPLTLILLSSFLLIATNVSSQNFNVDNYSYGWQIQGVTSTAGDTPFWLHSNRRNEMYRYSANGTLSLFASGSHTFDSGISLSAKTDLFFRGADESAIRFQQIYGQISYSAFQLTAGRKLQNFGFVHPELSMGTVDLSHNARPMMQINFSTEDFQPVPFTDRVVYYDASLAHGWKDDTEHRYGRDVLVHQKHLYLRFFSDDAPVSPRAGIKHFAHWGGDFTHLGDDAPVKEGAQVNLQAYRDVFFSLASDSKEILEGGGLPNRHQNHFGSYDFALVFNQDAYRVELSRQFILEDTPNARFGTPWDGLWGVTLELRNNTETRWRDDGSETNSISSDFRPAIQAIHYEHINTLDGLTRYEHRDRERHVNYYNHSTYRGGWTYEGRSLGNPLFIGEQGFIGVVNNQLVGHHLGLMGYAGPMDWRLFTTYSRNYGAGRATRKEDGNRVSKLTDRKDQWSFMMELQTETLLPSLKTTAAIAYDTGDLYPNNLGILLSIRWSPN